VVARILRHLSLPTTSPPVAPARSRALQAELIDDLDADAFTEHGDHRHGLTPQELSIAGTPCPQRHAADTLGICVRRSVSAWKFPSFAAANRYAFTARFHEG
jgi:hypothetical protein